MKQTNRLLRRKYKLRSRSPLMVHWLNTPLRCHVVCGISAFALVASSCLLWLRPELLAADRTHQPQEIAQAIELISNRNQFRNQYRQAQQQREENQSRVDRIAGWLPESRSWEDVRSVLQDLATDCDVQLVTMDRGTTHGGIRVAVLDTECEIQGTYGNVCEFLHRIVAAELPIWCDEIQVVRAEGAKRPAEASRGNHPPVRCLATLSLRVPYAGKATTAAKLLQRRSDDDS
ncbi:hypothetical protein Mal15_37600 [Stieleria maiorica]|uniref:Uncharacterized protein n=1 Tax=Stieleria maiorica TaxID=2795974 RepID=A0A5B9MJ72_9BACT|nr:hypothetical protein [Stieleria maiorica]QEF99694.1 hypothetical protein Mal15_37600 [Stieleria maiorica]